MNVSCIDNILKFIPFLLIVRVKVSIIRQYNGTYSQIYVDMLDTGNHRLFRKYDFY